MSQYFYLYKKYKLEFSNSSSYNENASKGIILHYNKENKITDYIDNDLSQWPYGEAFDWQALETLASSSSSASGSQSNDNKDNKDNNDDTKDEEKNNTENKEKKEKSAGQHVATLKALAIKIDNVINEMKCANGIFIRLSTRSPKDSALESMGMYKQLYNQLLNKAKTKKRNDNKNENKQEAKINISRNDDDSINTSYSKDSNIYQLFQSIDNSEIVDSFYRCSIQSLCVLNGIDAIELLCRSYRTFVDINMSMLKQGELNFRMNLVIRKWYDIIDPNWEFRMFIKNKIATSMTQYHSNVVIPKLYKVKKEIEINILDLYNNKIKPILNDEKKYPKLFELNDFTVDFAVIVDNDNNDNNDELAIKHVYMIEINHFPPIAGTALFDWKNENDRNIIENKNKNENENQQFELRIHENVEKSKINFDKLDLLLPDPCVDFIKLLRNEYENNDNQDKDQDDAKDDGIKDSDIPKDARSSNVNNSGSCGCMIL